MSDPTRDFIPKPEAVPPTFKRQDGRGLFVEVVNEGPWETVITGHMKAGARMGDHYHRECRAFFFLIRGSAKVEVKHLFDDTTSLVMLEENQGLYFLPFETHAVSYLSDSDFILLKSYRYREDRPDIFPAPL